MINVKTGVSQKPEYHKGKKSKQLFTLDKALSHGLYWKRALIPVKAHACRLLPYKNMPLIGTRCKKTCPNFCRVFRRPLPGTRTQQGSSEVEAHGLWKLGQVSRMEKGPLSPYLFCGGHYVRYCPAAPQNMEGPLALPFSYTWQC